MVNEVEICSWIFITSVFTFSFIDDAMIENFMEKLHDVTKLIFTWISFAL